MAATTILFVCFGNTCRSPMAEGLARKMLGEQVYVESAGVAPHNQKAADDAVSVMANDYGVDISSHRPRRVYDLPLDLFDWIVAIDQEIYDTLYSAYPKNRSRLIGWQVEDPIGRGEGVYRQTAATIEEEIRKLAG